MEECGGMEKSLARNYSARFRPKDFDSLSHLVTNCRSKVNPSAAR